MNPIRNGAIAPVPHRPAGANLTAAERGPGYPSTLPRGDGGAVLQNSWAFYPLFPLLTRPLLAAGLPWEVAVPTLAVVLSGLAMLVAYPFWAGYRAIAKRVGGFGTWVRNVGLFLAAPLIGLLYALALPFVGLGMLAWMGIRALRNRAHTA